MADHWFTRLREKTSLVYLYIIYLQGKFWNISSVDKYSLMEASHHSHRHFLQKNLILSLSHFLVKNEY